MRWIGPYQVFEEIGRGSGGVVYRALDPAIGRDVAIKELRLSQLAPDEIPEARLRFLREASGSHPVGAKQANAYGLYDMLGNVWEWTADNYDVGNKVVRGGSWGTGVVRASFRSGVEPKVRNHVIGFAAQETIRKRA